MIIEGAEVDIEYTLTVEGEVVDTSVGRGPVTYIQGRGDLLPGLERELLGLEAGDHADVVVSPEQGYGPHNPMGVQKVPFEAFGDPAGVEIGRVVTGEDPAGHAFKATITDVDDGGVTLDLNHPLAGKTLHFQVDILAIRRIVS